MSGGARWLGRYRTRVEEGRRRVVPPVVRFIRVEETAGWPLLAAALAALLWRNSPWGDTYAAVWQAELVLETPLGAIGESLQKLVTDLLLPLFFFVAGIEIKREVTRGALSTPRRAALPVALAVGGMAVPAAVYLAFNLGRDTVAGWGVPVATDIAFALGVLALLGRHAPPQLRVLVLAFAAADDVGGVLVIAFAYSHGLSWIALAVAAAGVAVIVLLHRAGVHGEAAYLVLGLVVFFAVLASGVHSTIAGVVLGLMMASRAPVPVGRFLEVAGDELEELRQRSDRLEGSDEDDGEARAELQEECDARLGRLEALTVATESPVDRWGIRLNPWVSYLVLPLFALANAGVEVTAESLSAAFTEPAGLGVVAALVVGKPVGILLLGALATTLGLARLPDAVRWVHLAGVGLLAGIGFTVSLFIAELAFAGEPVLETVKLAVFAASLIAAVGGFVVLRAAGRPAE